jgi:hypothetical protein
MKLKLALAALVLCGGTANATPERHIVNPNELMVITPGLEYMGASRISTVRWCEEVTGVADYQNLVTDYELESMEACYAEHE